MSDDTFQKIQDSKALFDLDGAHDEVTQQINSMAGLDCGSMDDVANGDDTMGSAEAATAVKLQSSAVWIRINEGLKVLLEDFQKQSKNPKLPREERLSALDKAAGLEAGIALVGGIFSAANEVVDGLKKEDIRALGTDTYRDVKAARAVEPVAAPASNPYKYSAEEIAENSKRAAAFLEKLPKRTN